MAAPLGELVKCWIAWGGIDPRLAGDLAVAGHRGSRRDPESCRPGADPRAICDWEERHGYRLPAGLRAWLMLSNGLFGTGPLIHPISAIGPMIPFARVPDLIVQPESWFELGNPNLQTVCIDLAYRLPDGGCPIFTSGDDASHSPPRIIARSFEEWFLELLRQGGGNTGSTRISPISATRGSRTGCHVANPRLSGRLRPYAERVAQLLRSGADEREIAVSLGLDPPRSRADLPPSAARQSRAVRSRSSGT